MPDLFPSAVAQGLIAESLSWSEATKLALALAALAGILASRKTGGASGPEIYTPLNLTPWSSRKGS